jgi:hypothetical protein
VSDERPGPRRLTPAGGDEDELDVDAALGEILLGVEPVEPPPAVRARLLARVADAPRRPARERRWLVPALAASLAGLLAAAGAALLSERSRVAPLRAERGALVAERDSLASELGALRDERGELEATLEEQDAELGELESSVTALGEQVRMLRAPGVEWVELAGADPQSRAAARVAWEWEDYECYLHATGLPALAEGESYALWLYPSDADPVHAGTFEVDFEGSGSLFSKLPKRMGHEILRTIVTREPAPVGDAPAGPVVLASGG